MNYRKPQRGRKLGEPLEISDRLLLALSYGTILAALSISALFTHILGLAGIVCLIVCAVTGRLLRSFIKFHIFQSIFISVLIYLFNIIFSILYNIIMFIPIIKNIFSISVYYLNIMPLIFGFSILQFSLVVFTGFLAFTAFSGKIFEIPYVSKTVRQLI